MHNSRKNLHKIITDGTQIGKYLAGEGPANDAKVKSWLDEDPENNKLYNDLRNEKKLSDVLDELDQFNEEKAWARFRANRILSFRNTYRKWIRIAAVFVLVLGLSSVMVYYFAAKEKTEPFTEASKMKPGGPKAYLILPNGPVINLTKLNHLQKKQLKKSTGFDIIDNTVIAQKNVKPSKEKGKTQYYTLVIPKGGEYKIILEDSTEIWLNADSKLTFPEKFSQDIRDVDLVGEAYFKIKKDKSHPFIVRLNDMDIKVLGTEFNTSAYPDDPQVTTTLVNGSITVYYKTGITGQQNLLPGDQASYNKKENVIHLETVDVAKFKTWKDGFFVFDNQPLSAVTKILERWYDVRFIIQNDDLKKTRFSGQFMRYEDISAVLDIIRKTGTKVKFNREGRIIKITT